MSNIQRDTRGDRVVPKDHTIAAKWFMLAASKGNADAQYILGGLYRRGKGVPKNQETALNWYKLAAKQGHALAQNRKKLSTNQTNKRSILPECKGSPTSSYNVSSN